MPDSDQNRNNSHWRIDKSVPVPHLVAMFVQTVVFAVVVAVGWANLTNRVDSIEVFVEETKAAQVAAIGAERDRGDRLVRLETLMGEIHRSLINIERQLSSRQFQEQTERPARR